MFSNRFDVVISEMNFKKWKTILFWCIYEQKTFWKATATALLKTPFFDMFTKCNGWWRPTNINQNSSLKKAKSKNMLSFSWIIWHCPSLSRPISFLWTPSNFCFLTVLVCPTVFGPSVHSAVRQAILWRCLVNTG